MNGGEPARATGWLHALRFHWIGAILRGPVRSLPGRIILAVFGAALVTSLVVSWLSTRSLDSFLRQEMDERFPAILRGTSERLSLWYAQRELDLETFARSETVLAGLAPGPGRRVPGDPRQALRQYLGYVLERFTQYEALFVLAPDGSLLLHVGRAFELPAELRARLAAVADSRVEDLAAGGRRFQVASAAVRAGGKRQGPSLHALLREAALAEVLASEELGASAGLYLVEREGAVRASSPGAPPVERLTRPLPARGEAPVMLDHLDEGGTRVVGSAMSFPRFGWSLVVEQPYDEAFAPVVPRRASSRRSTSPSCSPSV
jgi:hypothetical protein